MRQKAFRFPVTTLAGSTVGNIRAITKHYAVEPRYRMKYALSAGVAGIFSGLNGIERLAWSRRIAEFTPGKPPVFIIGFWRSGTTLLHNLMCQDPDAAYTTTFQTVFPNIILTQSFWLKPLVNIFLPAKRPFDNVSMDMDFPQEEEFGMMNMQPSTIYKFFIFPADFERIIEEELFPESLSPENLKLWKEQYSVMIAKAVFNTGGTRFVSKNPCNLARISMIREMYPDARFLFIHRNPYQVIESLYQFILSIFPGVQLQDTPADFSRENVVRLYVKLMDHYFSARSILPEETLIELRMDDFVADPAGQLACVYEKFNLGDYGAVLPGVKEFLSKNPGGGHVPVHPLPETRDLVNRYAAHILKELDYKVL